MAGWLHGVCVSYTEKAPNAWQRRGTQKTRGVCVSSYKRVKGRSHTVEKRQRLVGVHADSFHHSVASPFHCFVSKAARVYNLDLGPWSSHENGFTTCAGSNTHISMRLVLSKSIETVMKSSASALRRCSLVHSMSWVSARSHTVRSWKLHRIGHRHGATHANARS